MPTLLPLSGVSGRKKNPASFHRIHYSVEPAIAFTFSLSFTVHYVRWVFSVAISQYPSAILSWSFQKKTLKISDPLWHVLSSVWIQQKNAAITKIGDFSHSASNKLSLQKTDTSFHLHHRALWKFHQWRIKYGESCFTVLLHTLLQRESLCRRCCHVCQMSTSTNTFSPGRALPQDLCSQEVALIHVNVFYRN